MNLDLGVSEGQQNLFGKCILDFWMKFDKFSKGKEESLDHWIRPLFNLMSWLRPKHLFWFSNLRMKSQKLINWMIYMKLHLSDFTTDLHRSHVCNQWLRRKTYVTPSSGYSQLHRSLPPAQAPTPIKMWKQGLNKMILKRLLHNVLQLCKQNSQVHLDE